MTTESTRARLVGLGLAQSLDERAKTIGSLADVDVFWELLNISEPRAMRKSARPCASRWPCEN